MRCEYIDHMGSDLSCVNAARVSFDKESEWKGKENTLSERDSKLISYLARHNHFTPFTHCQITLRETVPIFVARQRFKHSIGFTYNEVSRRYVDDEPEFFYPMWRERPEGSVKQGSGRNIEEAGQKVLTRAYDNLLEHAESFYEEMIEGGVAPEQARMVLPQSMYTSYYVTGSLFAFARAYLLRKDSDAQVEIQELAHQWDRLISPLFPVSWSALTEPYLMEVSNR